MLKFILLDSERDEEPRNRAMPVSVSLPGDIPHPSPDKIKDWVTKLVSKQGPSSWRWIRKLVLSERDAELSPEIRKMFEFVDWDAVPPLSSQVPECSDPAEAMEYVKIVGAPVPALEDVISSDTTCSYRYAMDYAGKFPKGEPAIAKDILKSLNYANSIGTRIKPAEEKISKDEKSAFNYGEVMRKNNLWNSWEEDDLMKSPVWMYQYAKDHVGGVLPDHLHNAMHMMSITMPSNKWIKKYFGAKKYRPKN